MEWGENNSGPGAGCVGVAEEARMARALCRGRQQREVTVQLW